MTLPDPPSHRSPTLWSASAPGRINLIGEHTDYNLGFTLPMAIDRRTIVTAELNPSAQVHTIQSDRFPESRVALELDGSPVSTAQVDTPAAPRWSKYLSGVMRELAAIGCRFPALQIRVTSDVPFGAGLSSSASIEVALAILLQQISGQVLTQFQTALLCQQAEHQHVGVPCGLMDQLASISAIQGHLMLLDCRSNSIQQIPFPADLAIAVVNSQVKHELAEGEYALRRDQCLAACRALGVDSLRDLDQARLEKHQAELPELLFRRARHVVTENRRTIDFVACLRKHDWLAAGEEMYASQTSMSADFEISTPEIDSLVEIARSLGPDHGVFGSRMTGGGFGGCTISLVARERAESILDQILNRYQAMHGSRLSGFVTRPSDGAGVLNGLS